MLDDFHPIRKIFNNINCYSSNEIKPGGDYFDTSLIEWPVAYEDQFPEEERNAFPKCLLRMWTASEILNNLIDNGLCLKRYDEHPRLYQKQLPGSYIVVAEKV